ncbi:MAG TPA: universal stress protein [Arenicellales bacterium]|nr:universal stress protein [Arenicellales bacterium]
MKTILLPYRGDERANAPLELAYAVATHFGGYIEGLFVRQPPPLVSGEGITIPGDYITELEEEARHASQRAKESFAQFMSGKGVPLEDVRFAAEGASAGWRDAEGFESRVVGEHGRLFDLIIVGCASRPSAGENDAVCEAALFDSGRPVMMAPAEPPETLGRTIVVAWNGSTETARTIGFGMPFLLDAEKVVVLTVEGSTVPGPGPDQVADHLVRNGVKAEAKTVPSDGRAAGQAILDECRAAGADLLLKGAYTHSRLRQMIFGGATSHILAHADLPVFMAH